MQGVEQEMRIELRPQRCQPCLGQLRVQLGGMRLKTYRFLTTYLVAPEIVTCEPSRDDGEVDHEVVQPEKSRRTEEGIEPCHPAPSHGEEDLEPQVCQN